ncbi:MAG: nucleoside 2-deoxyribosyltransferase [Clostridiales bacterium]|nr:nucleoside 2-deoxyribosyltransferase [Clostridiales bacterium]
MNRECIYIAGPECFYTGGFDQLNAMRRLAEANGFSVSLPNDMPLKLDHEDLRENADAIFQNCADSMNRSTAILCDLEFFRGPEVDAGSVFEIGMAYARGIACYGYTRDKRDMKWKYQGLVLRDGLPYDRKGRVLPYWDLPFSPNVVGSTKIIEGGFWDCLKLYLTDLEESRKRGEVSAMKPPKSAPTGDKRKPVLYFAGPERYDADAQQRYMMMKRVCDAYGYTVVTPMDGRQDECDDPYTRAYRTLERNQNHVHDCDIIVANLNDFHGWEPESDTAFECGMAYQLGKRMYGYMDSSVHMRERVPNLGAENGWRDICGCNVENFDYPLNLMFSSSMKILEGKFEQVIAQIAEDLLRNK